MPVALPTLTKDSTLADVRNAQVEAAKALIELRAKPTDKRTADHPVDVKEVADFLINGDLIERALDSGERAARAAEEETRNKAAGGRSFGAGLGTEYRSMGAQAVETDEFTRWAEAGGLRNGKFETEVRNLIGEFTGGAFQTGSDAFLPVGQPQMVAGSQQRRRAFVRNLMSVQGTGLRTIPYMRELNQITNETGAQMVSEGSAKPEVTLSFERYLAFVEKIAAWLPATEEILTDAPTLRGYIDTRLEYMLMIREEQQILFGSGASPQLPGLDTLAGTQSQPMATGGGETAGDYSATIGKAIGLIENVDGEPDGVVANPIDYWTAVTKRHANQFDNGFGTGAPAAAAQNITWGLPVVRTRAMTSGTAWTASWALGSTLFDRQQTTIKVGDQHSDFFVRNLLVILAEKRIAVAWHRPNLFVRCAVPVT